MNIKETVTHIKSYIESRGYSFPENTIESIYLSLKTKPVIMLRNTNGQDSAILARLFFEALDVSMENKRFKVVCPGAFSDDIRSLICYTDSQGGFCAGEIVKFIIKASEDSENIYALYIDDINLVNPDKLLREILNACDTTFKTESGKITYGALFDEDIFNTPDEKKEYSGIFLPDNLFIIAGICSGNDFNPISERIKNKLDIISFNSDTTKILPAYNNIAPLKNINADFLKCIWREYSLEEIQNSLESYIDILSKINQPLTYIEKGFGITTRNEILFYLTTNKIYNLMTDDEAFDCCLVNRILTKIQGCSSELKNVLSLIFRECVTKGIGDYYSDSLKMYRALSYPDCRFRKSAEKIAGITRHIEEDGYYAT